MAISTYQTYLMKGTGTDDITYSKLIDIKDFPDLGGAPEMLETTTLSDAAQTFIKGIQTMDALEFTANYDATDFETIKELTGPQKLAVWFGATSAGVPDGNRGKFSFDGEIDVYVSGGEVNAVVDMVVTIAPTTPIKFETTV